MKICLVGLGKLGYPMSLFLSSSGYQINCYDKDKSIYKKITDSNYLRYEENLNDFNEYKNNLINFDSLDVALKDTSICFITVPTPSKLDGSFSLDNINMVLDNIGHFLLKKKLSNPYIINICSTVSPGSCDNQMTPYLEKIYNLKEGIDFVIAYNPYFVALGSVVKTLLNPDFVLIGCKNRDSLKNLLNIYNAIYSQDVKIKLLSLKEAEIVKIFINTFLTLKISYSNYMQLISLSDKELSLDKILDCIGEDKRIGKSFLQPGLPYGGPCLPRDNEAAINFTNKIEVDSSLNRSSILINKIYFSYLFSQIDYLIKNNIKKISFLGIGYRPNTDCIEDSISIALIDYCLENNLEVSFYDFYINLDYKKIKKYSSLENLMDNSNLIFIPYKDKKFNQLLNFQKNNFVILDFFNQFNNNNNNNNIRITNDLRKIDLTFLKKTAELDSKILKFSK
jgi:UDPglucose 6-dehydrogenase